MQTAGVHTPTQTQRIWMWLNDHQPQSAKQISMALKMPQASSLLSQMEQRRMVVTTPHLNRSSGITIKLYSVVGREYAYLTLPPKPVVAKPTAQVFAIQFQPTEPVQCSQAAPTPAAFDLDSMTIAEARALYTRLASMFRGEV